MPEPLASSSRCSVGVSTKGIAAERQLRQGPGQQALVLWAVAARIDQQQIEIAAHSGVTPAVAAE